ncbi:glycosyltransferase family 4 protein [Leifsonia sp. ZF2019]|uniref:glycosyltransferase family 4 protein n=1 Tax=Leifsonia sp. ZF2019 TaxID=2781978 RepID=UPI001CBB8183|nr:glycosyltransferase family 1 protein [Leifsonia sp. ZF2019]UAJ80568.1 glycosyltransferase family 4 protein [Leifsonia sp. ZF2019]
MPRILVDLLFLTGRKGGMESYLRRLYSAMPQDAGVEFVGVISREAEALDLGWFPGETVRSGIAGEDRVAWALGELRSVAPWARKAGAALVHSPANVGPVRSSVPVALTVHDALPFAHPEWVPGRHATVLRWLVRRAARNAARVITISDASRDDIVRHLGVPEERIDVIPLAGGADVPVGPVPLSGRPTVLTMGNRLPHKNGETLVAALAELPAETRPRLVVTGETDGVDPLHRLAERLGVLDDVDFVGWVSADALERLYADATVVAVPSLFEGFGLPVLEGMSRGRPVVCSDLPVLHETGGPAASYVPATDPRAWAAELSRLLGDSAERERLIAAGLRRTEEFSWRTTAERTLASFQRALEEA